MITTVNDWITTLRSANSALGFPLVIGGFGLMLFGWRLWKLCVVLAYGLIGAIAGALLYGEGNEQWMYSIAGAVILAAASYWPVNYSVSLLGGILGAAVSYFYLGDLDLSLGSMWALCGAVGVCCTAYAFINRRHVVILVTAFFGAVLLISGITTWLLDAPAFFGTVRALSKNSVVVVPFVLLVPTVMSCFYQIAEVRRLQIDV